MNRGALLSGLIGLGTLFANTAAPAQDIMGPLPGVRETSGPTMVCGHNFALRLVAGERARQQEGVDFSLFYVDAADGPFLLYEGGHPQPHDDEIRIGSYWVIAIHDNRSAEAKARSAVRSRLLTGAAATQACPQQRRSE